MRNCQCFGLLRSWRERNYATYGTILEPFRFEPLKIFFKLLKHFSFFITRVIVVSMIEVSSLQRSLETRSTIPFNRFLLILLHFVQSSIKWWKIVVQQVVKEKTSTFDIVLDLNYECFLKTIFENKIFLLSHHFWKKLSITDDQSIKFGTEKWKRERNCQVNNTMVNAKFYLTNWFEFRELTNSRCKSIQ